MQIAFAVLIEKRVSKSIGMILEKEAKRTNVVYAYRILGRFAR